MKKNLFSIQASLPFADILAQWIQKTHGQGSFSLPRVLVLLPTQRACLSLREAFLRVTDGKPTLLPRMQALADVDEDVLLSLPGTHDISADMPHPSYAGKRLFLLARLIRAYQSNVHGKTERMDHAVSQAREVVMLLDQVEREGASLANLATLAPENFAAHWQLTTEFLNIVAEHWPAIEAEKQLMSQQSWRNQSLQALAAAWSAAPPDYPVIAAGTTGSIASTAALLKVIAGLPQGAVVLPGLDIQASRDYAEHVDESHPQWGMLELLKTLGLDREDVQEMGAVDTRGQARSALLSLALSPPELLPAWRTSTIAVAEAVQGLSCVALADQQEEAQAIALMLREVLETPAKTAALVTHDRALARRVAAEMLRFSVAIDDSAGQKLAETPTVSFLRLLLEVVSSNAAPAQLLALLKHPFAHAGMERIECLDAARELEREMLRGLCPAYGLTGLMQALKGHTVIPASVHALLSALEKRLAPLLTLFAHGGAQEFSALLEAHMQCAEALAGKILWDGAEAKALATFIDELRDAAADAGLVEVVSYPSLFDALLVGKVVRPDYGMHPRLRILSPLEARMQSFDRIIIGGLNEGSWPPQVAGDPWFNRMMRAAIGLASPERQIGQAAHDFMMLANAPEVIITRAEKVDGSPATPARWWVRLMTLLEHYGMRQQVQQAHYAHWACGLDAADSVKPCARPAPAPPLTSRPLKVAVTQVERWLSDPYAFYAANILGLKKLDEIDQNPAASDFGNSVHKALQIFAEKYPAQLPDDALNYLIKSGIKTFELYNSYPVAAAWWWPRFEQVAAWMIEREKELRPSLAHVWPEIKGSFELSGITFTGRADRVEQNKQGGLAIVDYKTGGAHSKKDTFEGNAVQLMLLALIAQEGRWDAQDITARQVTRLEYWIAGGGRNSGEIRAVNEAQIADYASIARERLASLVAEYSNPTKTYEAAVDSANRYNDYEHLARIQEWR